MGTWIHPLVELIFPPVCAICGEMLAPMAHRPEIRWAGHGLCARCAERIHWLEPPFCPHCAKPIRSFRVPSHPCGQCMQNPPPFRSARAAVLYGEEIHPFIHRMKYGSRASLARFMGELMAWRLSGHVRTLRPDGIIPIPLHPSRLRQRGFNQASIMAKVLGKRAGVSVLHDALTRRMVTKPQVGLSRVEREANVRGAFGVRRPKWLRKGRWVLLDDVYTTGATLREAARTLRRARAAEVHVLTFARAL